MRIKREQKGINPAVAVSVIVIVVAAVAGSIYVLTRPALPGDGDEDGEMPPEVRAYEYRPPALEGESPVETAEIGMFTGLDVKPKRKYVIAFSNGSMVCAWRYFFVNSLETWAREYGDAFGIEYMWTNAGGDAVRQIQDIKSLLARNPDFLLISPQSSKPLTVVYDLCAEKGIPFMTLDRSIDADAGTGMYITEIIGNNYLGGVQRGMMVVDLLTKKYGRPVGHVVEIYGGKGVSIGEYRSQGLHRVVDQYPDIRVIGSLEGHWDVEKIYEKTKDALETFPNIDIFACDGQPTTAVKAVEESGRTGIEVISIDGYVETFKYIIEGDIMKGIAEYAPNYGMFAFAMAIQWLNGDEIESRYILPSRTFYAGLETREDGITVEAQEEAIIETYNKMVDEKSDFPKLGWGYYDTLALKGIDQYYPTPFKHYEDPEWRNEYPAYTTNPPLEEWPPA